MSHWQLESPDRLHGAANQSSLLSPASCSKCNSTARVFQLSEPSERSAFAVIAWLRRAAWWQVKGEKTDPVGYFLVSSFLPEVKAQLFHGNGWPSEASGPTVAHVSSWIPVTPVVGSNSADRTPRSSPSRNTHASKLGLGDIHHIASLNSCLN